MSTQSAFNKQLAKGRQHLRGKSAELDQWMTISGPCKLTVDWERSLYEALVRAVAHQQLHARAAQTILGRLCAGFRGHDFPTPKQLARASTEKLRGMGFSAAKTLAIQGIAAAALSQEIPDRDTASTMTDEALIEQLLPLRGVGRWTVEMILIFTLGRLDVMPGDDYGVKSGLQHLFQLDTLPKKIEVDMHTVHWQPYRTIAAWYLWRKADSLKP